MPLDAKAGKTLARWHEMVAAEDLSRVGELCAPDVVFRSPVAFTPYKGAELVAAFLQQAVQAFDDFRYHRTFADAIAASCSSSAPGSATRTSRAST